MRQGWVGTISLLSFLDAVTGFLAKAPYHLASVASNYSAQRSRLLFLMGFLHVICGHSDEAKGRLRQAAQSALDHQDLDWAYFVAQCFREYEQWSEDSESKSTTSKLHTSQKPPWERLALDFLNVYDLSSAIGLARKNPRDPLQGPRAIRFLLWGLAFLVGVALLASDKWLSAASQAWREAGLFGVSALAILGAPLALGVGARGALQRLFPDILYPRILGAIVVASVNLCVNQDAGTVASPGLLVFSILLILSLGGGALYLHSEVRKKVGDGRESWLRCLDIFSLAFLEATSLSTIFALVYERTFLKAFIENHEVHPEIFTIGGIFLRPQTIFLMAILSMLIGIVVELMFQSAEKHGEERSLWPD